MLSVALALCLGLPDTLSKIGLTGKGFDLCELSLGLIFLEEEGTEGEGTPSFVLQIPAPRQLSEVWLLWLTWVDNGQISFGLDLVALSASVTSVEDISSGKERQSPKGSGGHWDFPEPVNRPPQENCEA